MNGLTVGCSFYPLWKECKVAFVFLFVDWRFKYFFTWGCGGNFTWTLLKVLIHVGVVWLLRRIACFMY